MWKIKIPPLFVCGIFCEKGKQSRLIESLMLRIPLPLFYAAADKDDELVIVDGLQRTSTIDRFINKEEFKLEGLEFLHEYEGKNIRVCRMR
jgi:uncharacterized protein with ParB-like and HNH nuclease domain